MIFLKILHTSDWHIGRILNEFSLLDDQEYILKEMFKVIENEKPDVIIISGDIYDRSIPPKEAVELLDRTLTQIIEEYNIPTMIVSGNHDSQERLSFGNELLKHKQLYIEGMISNNIKKITMSDEYGLINFYLLPYIHPLVVRDLFNEVSIKDHQEAFKFLMDKIYENLNTSERNILITHNYIISDLNSIILSDSERSLSCGGIDYIDASLVEMFDYVALGHLHNYQKVKKDCIRYSGSILKYSFSEANFKKGVIILDIKEKGKLESRFVELKPKRDLIILEGELDTLIQKETYQKIDRSSYILAILTDSKDLYDPIGRLRAIYPNLMRIQRNNFSINENVKTRALGDFKNKNEITLFSEFYQNITGNSLDEESIKILHDVINEVIREDKE